MNIKPISYSNQTFKSAKPNMKITKTAYSALFALSLISAGLSSHKSNLSSNSVNLAQTVYTDGMGNHWVPYSEYTKQYNRYNDYEARQERYENLIIETGQKIQQTHINIQEKIGFIEKADAYLPNLEAQADELMQTSDNIEDSIVQLRNNRNVIYLAGGVIGVILGLLTRGIYNIVKKNIKKK